MTNHPYSKPKGGNVVLNTAPDFWYRPDPGNGVNLYTEGSYTLPIGDDVNFNFGIVPPEPVGYIPTFDLKLTTGGGYIPTFDLELGTYTPVDPVIPTPTIEVTPYKLGWGIARPLDSSTNSIYERTTALNTTVTLPYQRNKPVDNPFLVNQVRLLNSLDKPYLINRRDEFNKLNKSYNQPLVKTLKPVDINYKIVRVNQFDKIDVGFKCGYTIPPTKDTYFKEVYNSVRLQGADRIPIYSLKELKGYDPTFDINLISGIPYLPSNDLNIENIYGGGDIYPPYDKPFAHDINFDFNKPYDKPNSDSINLNSPASTAEGETGELIGYEKTPIQPTGNNFITKAGKPSFEINYFKSLQWGYGLNNFVIGGQWKDIYGGDLTPPPDPDEPIHHPDYGVFLIVNTVNIFAQPSNTAINFESFSLSYDVDSFVWTSTFTVTDRESYNLIKPVGRSVKEIIININGDEFKLFVGSTSTKRSADSTGKVVESYSCQAWSTIKRLAFPYSAKKSFSDNTVTTAASAVNDEAVSKGFTSEWDTVNWNIPAGVHSYQDKTALGAILLLVNAIGGVLIPDKLADAFTVRPRYPYSPWNWYDPSTVVDRTMDETRFFSIDNNTVPKDNPDGVYVYGEEDGVGVKAVRIGTPGTALLPDVVDKYITTVAAGQERGRIEVANNSFIELIPMSTYIDDLGIINVLDLIEFTTIEGDKWRGQVMNIEITCTRIGTALIQNLTVARFFDNE